MDYVMIISSENLSIESIFLDSNDKGVETVIWSWFTMNSIIPVTILCRRSLNMWRYLLSDDPSEQEKISWRADGVGGESSKAAERVQESLEEVTREMRERERATPALARRRSFPFDSFSLDRIRRQHYVLPSISTSIHRLPNAKDLYSRERRGEQIHEDQPLPSALNFANSIALYLMQVLPNLIPCPNGCRRDVIMKWWWWSYDGEEKKRSPNPLCRMFQIFLGRQASCRSFRQKAAENCPQHSLVLTPAMWWHVGDYWLLTSMTCNVCRDGWGQSKTYLFSRVRVANWFFPLENRSKLLNPLESEYLRWMLRRQK